MASLLSSCAARTSLRRWPLLPRTPLHHSPPRRAFSASPSRRLSLVNVAVATPNLLLDSLHSLGLPWYAALPAAAVIARGVVVYYVAARPIQRAGQVRSSLMPLASVEVIFREHEFDERAHRRNLREARGPTFSRLYHFLARLWFTRQELNKLGRKAGAPAGWSRMLFNFSTLIAFTAAIRLKCGARDGLLPWLLSPFQSVLDRSSTLQSDQSPPPPLPAEPPKPVLPRDEPMAQRVDQPHMGVDAYGEPVSDLSQLGTPPSTTLAPTEYFDPSMHTEGLGWYLDLTAPDPTFTLPIVLWAAISLNIIYRRSVGGDSFYDGFAVTTRAQIARGSERRGKGSPGLAAAQRQALPQGLSPDHQSSTSHALRESGSRLCDAQNARGSPAVYHSELDDWRYCLARDHCVSGSESSGATEW
ncbi:hypothetical protein LTR53_006119 [Teratosphaeriaceae sp. CCFEE 6253]|nr:hypothetical protein LTR53_006119 [Teratosphaeriaceae sp. CCFEE 6253]